MLSLPTCTASPHAHADMAVSTKTKTNETQPSHIFMNACMGTCIVDVFVQIKCGGMRFQTDIHTCARMQYCTHARTHTQTNTHTHRIKPCLISRFSAITLWLSLNYCVNVLITLDTKQICSSWKDYIHVVCGQLSWMFNLESSNRDEVFKILSQNLGGKSEAMPKGWLNVFKPVCPSENVNSVVLMW